MNKKDPLFNEVINLYKNNPIAMRGMTHGDNPEDYLKKYYLNSIETAVKLSDGKIVIIRKNRIETTFLCGYSSFGQGISYKDACDSVSNFNTHKHDSFINMNLRDIETHLSHLIDFKIDIKLEKTFVDGIYEIYVESGQYKSQSNEFLKECDRIKLIGKCGKEIEAFKKRLENYYKRYPHKIHTRIYSMDD